MAAAARSRLDGRRGWWSGGGGRSGRGLRGRGGLRRLAGRLLLVAGPGNRDREEQPLSPPVGRHLFLGGRLWAATSSLVTVCGFNCATSFQDVSLPGAAPLST